MIYMSEELYDIDMDRKKYCKPGWDSNFCFSSLIKLVSILRSWLILFSLIFGVLDILNDLLFTSLINFEVDLSISFPFCGVTQ